MTYEERRPTGLLHTADELRQLIRNNPTLPLLVFAGEEANSGDYSYMSCSYIKAYKGEFLDCAQTVNDCMSTPTGTSSRKLSRTLLPMVITPMRNLTLS